MIISENSFRIDYLVDTHLLDLLEYHNIFTFRTGLNRRECSSYKCRFKTGNLISINKESLIEPFSTISNGSNFYSIGSFSSIASSLPIKLKVGRFTEIGQNVSVLGFRHPIEAVTTSSASFNFCRENIHTYLDFANHRDGTLVTPSPADIPQPNEKEIIIGNDVWIGSNVVLSGGIEVGDGAIIAANSIVTKSVLPYTIVGGNPAKMIRYRFSENIISELKSIKWWEYELSDLMKLDLRKPEKFIENFHNHKGEIRNNMLTPLDLVKALSS